MDTLGLLFWPMGGRVMDVDVELENDGVGKR
jgi:hypothetical protein